jgi:hypothetical protein
MAESTICEGMKWGEALPSTLSAASVSRSLHWDGTEATTTLSPHGGRLELNVARGMFMYTFLGGWYKSFGIEGDTLTDLCASLFGDMAGGHLLLEDEHGKVLSVCLVWSGCFLLHTIVSQK